MGIFASMNQTIEEDVASKLAKSRGFELEIRHRGEKAEPQAKKVKKRLLMRMMKNSLNLVRRSFVFLVMSITAKPPF